MAGRRTTVYLPSALLQRAREENLNLSQLLADRLHDELSNVEGCPHSRLRCEDCGARLESFEELEDPPESFEELEDPPEVTEPAEPPAE